jgi:hypothetical protein
MDALKPAALERLKRMMAGGTFEKDMAENQLRECDPCTLPEDILDIWTTGSSYDKFRAGRVKQAWTEPARQRV